MLLRRRDWTPKVHFLANANKNGGEYVRLKIREKKGERILKIFCPTENGFSSTTIKELKLSSKY